MSQSAPSCTVRTLEARLGLRLLIRATRGASLAEAGERPLGSVARVDRDVSAARIGPDFRVAAVAAPSCLDARSRPLVPWDLTEHACIALRLPAHGGLAPWELRDGRELKVRVHGRAVLDALGLIRQAALDGLACPPEDLVEVDVREGRLVRVLADRCPPRPGHHLCHPSRREPSPAFALAVRALRWQDGARAAQNS